MNIFIELAPFAIMGLLMVAFILPLRLRMKRRARALLAQNPAAEQTSVYLELHSLFIWSRQREIDAKIAEMQQTGWTFLEAMESVPYFLIPSRRSGLTLHFIRTKV